VALINGEKETGITVQTINERLDAGDVLLQTRIPLTGR
jgi:methionyl-tRNA formyltransferase